MTGPQQTVVPGRSVALSLLLLAYTFSFIDRTIVAIIGQAIKIDLQLSDAQLGLLGGLSFAILYTLMGIPLARVAERWNRVSLISLSMLVWSAFTVACGYAQNFLQLLLFRVGVGVGEAGCSPPAHSLISDYFEPHRRATALAIYSMGVPLGSMFGAVAGGWIAQNLSWRLAFILVGLPGVALAVVIKLLMRNPEPSPFRAPPPFSIREEVREIGAVGRRLFARWPVANMVLGLTLSSFATYGWGQFSPPYFIRTFGLDYAQVGLITGLVVGLSAGLGTLFGGLVADWAGRRDPRWYALVPAIGTLIAAPLYVAAFLQPSWQAAGLLLLLPGVFAYAVLGPTYGVVQNTVLPHQRATATALLLFFLNFIALGFGPPFVGWTIDVFAQFNLAHPAAATNAWSAFVSMLADTPGSGESFAALCPGGVNPSHEELDARCRASLALATRQGILVSFVFYVWAGFHYLAAAVGLKRLLRSQPALAA